MADGVVADVFSMWGFCVCEVLAVGLEGGDDVELGEAWAGAWADGAAVDHDGRAVETGDWRERVCVRWRAKRRKKRRLTGDEDAWHVFVAAWDDDGGIEVVGSGGGLYGVSDEVAGGEGVGHAKGAHADSVADANGAILVGDGVAGGEGVLDGGAEGEEMLVASGRVRGERGKEEGLTGCPRTRRWRRRQRACGGQRRGGRGRWQRAWPGWHHGPWAG